MFFVYCENGVTNGGYPTRGHTYSTSLNNFTSISSIVSSGSPFWARSLSIIFLMPPRSAIIEPIMPPGSPQPSSRLDMCLLAGLMK